MLYLKGFIINTEFITSRIQEKISHIFLKKNKDIFIFFDNNNLVISISSKEFKDIESIKTFIMNEIKQVIEEQEIKKENFIISNYTKWFMPIRHIYIYIDNIHINNVDDSSNKDDFFVIYNEKHFIPYSNNIYNKINNSKKDIELINIESVTNNYFTILDKLLLNKNSNLSKVNIKNLLFNINEEYIDFIATALENDISTKIDNNFNIITTDFINIDIFKKYIQEKIKEISKILNNDIDIIKKFNIENIKNIDVFLFNKFYLTEKINLININKSIKFDIKDILCFFAHYKLSTIKILETANLNKLYSVIKLNINKEVALQLKNIDVFLTIYLIVKYQIIWSSSNDLCGIRKIIYTFLEEFLLENNVIFINFINEFMNLFNKNEENLRKILLSKIKIILKKTFESNHDLIYKILSINKFTRWKHILEEIKKINIQQFNELTLNTYKRLKGLIKSSNYKVNITKTDKEIIKNNIHLTEKINTYLDFENISFNNCLKLIYTLKIILENINISSLEKEDKEYFLNIFKRCVTFLNCFII